MFSSLFSKILTSSVISSFEIGYSMNMLKPVYSNSISSSGVLKELEQATSIGILRCIKV